MIQRSKKSSGKKLYGEMMQMFVLIDLLFKKKRERENCVLVGKTLGFVK